MGNMLKRAGFLVCAAASAICFGGRSCKAVAWEKQITEETVYVEGLEEEYSFLFLTDTHVVIQDDNASQQEQQYAQERYNMFQNQEGIPSAQQFPAWIAYANETEVDAVLLGGDIIDSPSDANVEWLQEQLAELEMPWLYVPGNHDWTYPWEYMTDYGKENYLPMLAPMMQGNPAIQSMEMDELLLVGVDDSTNQVNPNAIHVYEELLAQGKPVILVNHVPFATQTLLPKAVEAWRRATVIGDENGGGIRPDDISRYFLELTTAENSPVKLVLTGHVHLYDNGMLDEELQLRQIVGGAAYQGRATLIRFTGEKEKISVDKGHMQRRTKRYEDKEIENRSKAADSYYYSKYLYLYHSWLCD